MGDLEAINQTILKNIEAGCSQQFHFMESADNELETAKIISGFVNASGGDLLIGVRENGKAIGVNPSGVAEEITLITEKFLSGLISLKVDKVLLGRHYLISVQISSTKKKVAVKGNESNTYFVRVDSLTVPANKIILQVWKLSKQGKPFEIGDIHSEILTLSKEKESISLSYIYKVSNYKNRLLDFALSELIVLEKIKIISVKNEIRYSLVR